MNTSKDIQTAQNLAGNTAVMPSQADLMAQLEALRAENAALLQANAKKAAKRISLKVSAKGALSIYGMGRFPFTFYQEQILTLLDMADEIRAFLKAHASEFTSKADKVAADKAVDSLFAKAA